MLRKNFTSQYKLYSKSIQTLKVKILTEKDNAGGTTSLFKNSNISSRCTNIMQSTTDKISGHYNQFLKDVVAATESTLNRYVAYVSTTNNKMKDSNTTSISSVNLNKTITRNTLRICKPQSESSQIDVIRKTFKLLNARNRVATVGAAGVTVAAAGQETVKPAAAEPSNLIIEPIPEPPPIPDPGPITETISQVNALGEPTLESLGLGGWTPVGLVQHSLEYLHVAMDLPWWGAIAIGTVIVRILMFPLVVIAQRNAARMNNYLPQLQAIQLKMTEARQCGNQIDVARYSQEMMIFMKEKDVNPLKNMIVPLAQMPLFISFFMGLRKMANLPVDSLREGGMLWFTDLTVPDQYFALPIITSLTLWTTIELGTDSARLSSQNLQTMKYVLRALPVIILPFTVNFPGAILCYWVSSNFISLIQVGFLRIPTVRDYFKIEPLIKHDPQKMPIRSKGFVGGVKDSWTNVKITRELEERRKFDELQFQRAGRGPVVKTYKYDPTQQVNNPNAINAKKR